HQFNEDSLTALQRVTLHNKYGVTMETTSAAVNHQLPDSNGVGAQWAELSSEVSCDRLTLSDEVLEQLHVSDDLGPDFISSLWFLYRCELV
ncbi:Transaldolase, partial [Clarias magur]